MADRAEPTSSRTAFQGTVLRLDVEEWPGHPPHEVIHHLGAAAVAAAPPVERRPAREAVPPAVRQTLTRDPRGHCWTWRARTRSRAPRASCSRRPATGTARSSSSAATTRRPASPTSTSTCSGRRTEAEPEGDAGGRHRGGPDAVRARSTAAARGQGPRREDGARAAAGRRVDRRCPFAPASTQRPGAAAGRPDRGARRGRA